MRAGRPPLTRTLRRRMWIIVVLSLGLIVYTALADLLQEGGEFAGLRRFERSVLSIGFVVILIIALSGLGLSDRLTSLAVRDGLTGLYNQNYIKARLQEEIERSSRYRTPVSLLLIDIDDFRDLNDRLGHQAGDRVLKGFGAFLAASLRSSDIAGRTGGEEFLLVLPQTSALDAASTAERIRKEVASTAAPFGSHGGAQERITISAGVFTVLPYMKHGAEEAMGLADAGLDRAKREGKNRVVVFLK